MFKFLLILACIGGIIHGVKKKTPQWIKHKVTKEKIILDMNISHKIDTTNTENNTENTFEFRE